MASNQESKPAGEDERPGAGAEVEPVGEPINAADQLAYLADMASELRAMAHTLGAETLSDLLGLAHREASRVAARRRTTSA